MKLVKNLAIVRDIGLNLQDRDILVLNINVEYEDGGRQNIFGRVLDEWNSELKRRVGTDYGGEMIRSVLDFFGVDNLHDIKDRPVYVLSTSRLDWGSSSKDIVGLQHLNIIGSKKTPLIFSDVLEQSETYRKTIIREVADWVATQRNEIPSQGEEMAAGILHYFLGESDD